MNGYLYSPTCLHGTDVDNFTSYHYYVVQRVLDEHAASIFCTSVALAGCCTPQTETTSTISHTAEWIAQLISVWWWQENVCPYRHSNPGCPTCRLIATLTKTHSSNPGRPTCRLIATLTKAHSSNPGRPTCRLIATLTKTHSSNPGRPTCRLITTLTKTHSSNTGHPTCRLIATLNKAHSSLCWNDM